MWLQQQHWLVGLSYLETLSSLFPSHRPSVPVVNLILSERTLAQPQSPNQAKGEDCDHLNLVSVSPASSTGTEVSSQDHLAIIWTHEKFLTSGTRVEKEV